MFFSENPAPPNYTRFKNETFDELYELSLGTSDESEKIRLYQEMDQMLVEDAPVIFLFYDEISHFSSKRVSGISSNALNLLHVTDIHKEI